jgi:hypothetical protein
VLRDDTAERGRQQTAVDAITATVEDLATLLADIRGRRLDGEDPLPEELERLKKVSKTLDSTSKSIPRLSRTFPQVFSAFERTKLAQLISALKHILNKPAGDSFGVAIEQAEELFPASLFQVSLGRPPVTNQGVDRTPRQVARRIPLRAKHAKAGHNDTSSDEEESSASEDSESSNESASDSEEDDLKSDRKLLPPNYFQAQKKIKMPRNKTFLEFFLNRTQYLFTKFSGEKNCPTTLASFWKTFHKEVHIVKQASIPDKFAALLEVLEGRAKKEVEHLRHSGRSGYRQAWRTLFLNHGKFHEAKESLDEHVRRLRPKSASGKHIFSYLQLIDSARSRYQGLNLKSEDASAFLMEMLIKRLPYQIVNSYLDRHRIDISKKHLFYKENPRRSYLKFTSEIRQYLDYDCQQSEESDEEISGFALAAVGSLAPQKQGQTQGGSQGQGGKNPPRENPAVAAVKAKTLEFRPPVEDSSSPAKVSRTDPNQGQGFRLRCQFHPESSEHLSKACPSEVQEKKASLRRQKKCFNCFKPGHPARECPSPNNCLNLCCEQIEAGRKHHTFVCINPNRFTSKKKPYNPTRGPSFQGEQQARIPRQNEVVTASFVADQIEQYMKNQAPRSATLHATACLPSTSRVAICGSEPGSNNPQSANRTD